MSLVNTALVELQYLAPISYFAALSAVNEIVVEKFEHYQKQTYRNRCYLNTAQGVKSLIVPLTSKHGKTPITDIRIDHSQKWLNNHWRTIQSAYGNAPFYEYYHEDLHDVLFKGHTFLYDLNYELLTLCLKWLKWKVLVKESLEFEEAPASLLDLRGAINPKKPELVRSFYEAAVYHQVFGSKFVENLSLIDLIFCEGPGAGAIVRASSPK
jgi:hypothetical protein